jgi:hypothetical protein
MLLIHVEQVLAPRGTIMFLQYFVVNTIFPTPLVLTVQSYPENSFCTVTRFFAFKEL